MAIYHFSAKMISRSTGRSAVAAAAYRTAERIEDHRQGLEHDYSNRTGVLSSEILVPEGTPDSLRDRATLWNAVEAVERRKDAQLAREVTVALPHELDDAQRGDLVRSFVQSAFVDRGMIADVALHAPGKEGDQRNHHAHIMLTTRTIGADGFEGKDRSWNSKELLEDWRASWADHANAYLREIEVGREIDHRSLEAQREEKLDLRERALERGDDRAAHEFEIEAVELDRDPLPDIGWKAWGMERRGIQTTAGDLWREARGRLEDVRELVSGLRERFAETYARVRDVAEQSLGGLAEALRGADFSGLKETNNYVREQEREAEHSIESERDIGIDRDRGHSL
uniref:MobQ family relaxase n=1 Tax=Yoonia sp. TaxID=2212373 RepID=UPI0040475B06